MRKLNSILGMLLIVLLLFHAICGALKLTSLIPGGSVVMQIASYMLLAITAFHAVIGIKLSVDTIISCRRSKLSCFKNNGRFWMARFSGFALIFLIVFHYLSFSGGNSEVFRLPAFGTVQLIANILMVLALALHLVTNIRPLFIGLGLDRRTYLRDTMVVLSLVILLCGVAFVIYYLRWNVFWKY